MGAIAQRTERIVFGRWSRRWPGVAKVARKRSTLARWERSTAGSPSFDAATMRGYEEAGVTWWLAQAEDVRGVRELIAAGPP